MGLHLCYDLSLPAVVREAEAAGLVRQLRAYALTRPFRGVSGVIRLAGRKVVDRPRLRGLCYDALEDVAHLHAVSVRKELYWRASGLVDDEDESTAYWNVAVPAEVPAVALGFAVAPGEGSEPAAFGVARLAGSAEYLALGWRWHGCPKTQYASVHGDEHLLRVHGSLVDVLVEAGRLGFATEIRDEFGYWPERDPETLFAAARELNAMVARLAGAFTDAVRDAGHDSRGVDSPVFRHPDFERLEGG